jgi:hypothetical protein
MIEGLGAGEVAHHKGNAVIAGVDPGNDALGFHNRQTEPVHAGIDVNGGAAGPAGAAAKHIPFSEFVEVADHRLDVDLGVGLAAVLEEAVEHIDRRCGRHRRADHGGFVEGCHEKRLAAGAGERARDLFGAAAIGVGLDHAGAFGRHRQLLELAPISDDGVEIDGEGRGGGRQRGGLVGLSREDGAGRGKFRVGNNVHAILYAQACRGSTGQAASVGLCRQLAVVR